MPKSGWRLIFIIQETLPPLPRNIIAMNLHTKREGEGSNTAGCFKQVFGVNTEKATWALNIAVYQQTFSDTSSKFCLKFTRNLEATLCFLIPRPSSHSWKRRKN